MTSLSRRGSPRRWFRVACVTYDDADYETYFGRLGTRQRHPEFRTRTSAMRYAIRELRAIRGLGLPTRIWAPLPRHADSGHIHIVALATYRQVKKLFPSEELIREHGSLERRG
jgi:hypothetical protein